MKGLQQKYCLIPENLLKNLDEVAGLIKPGIKGFSLDCLKETISVIAFHVRKDEAATSLQMKILKQLIPQGDRYLMALVDRGIIVRSGSCKPGEASYRYDFSDYFKSIYTSLPLTDMRLVKRLNEAYDKFQKDGSKAIHGYCNQVTYLKKLTIADGYEDFIKSNFITETNKYNSIMASAIRIKNNDLFWTVDNTSGRFHSNVTNMSKSLRPFLRVNGEPLCNIDIKNSQPYLSTILLTNPGKVSWMTENPVFAIMLQTLKVSINQDVKKYISLVVSGTMYEYLMSEFAKEGIILTRKDTKEQMLRILFARNRSPKDELNRKCRNVFKKCFPTVHRIFSKVRGVEAGDKFQNFKRFAILLQRIESYLILDRILKRVYRELPGVVAITIHDSIMTGVLTNNVEAVRKIMLEEMTDFVGFSPKLSLEGKEGIRKEEGKDKQEGGITLTNIMLQPPQLTEHKQYN